MDIPRIRDLLQKRVQADLDALYQRFRTEQGTGEMTAFVADLHAKGLITNEHLREVLTSADVVFPVADGATVKRRPGPRFRRLGLLGRGAMGEVDIVRDEDLNRNVALKRMDPQLAKNASMAARFLTEAQVTAQLDHPAIVPVYDLQRGEDGSLQYSMKLIRGRTLEKYLDDTRKAYEAGRKPDDDHALPARLDLFLRVCDAIAHAHSRGVIHRDLKPENIQVGAYHEVIVMDWGIAKLIGTEDADANVTIAPEYAHQTQLGMAIGTPAYMSPEQAQGKNKQLDGRSDQYALGLILYEVVSLRRAITGRTALEVLARAGEGMRHRLKHVAGEPIPRELEAIIDKATAPRRRDRYDDVEALADDIRRYLRDEAVLARPDGAMQRVQRWISRHRQATLGLVFSLILAIFAVGAVVAVIGAAAFEWSRHTARIREERLASLLSVVGQQAHRMDTEFQHYEALITGFAQAAEYALESEPTPHPYYLDEMFLGGQPPPDHELAEAYADLVSLDFPIVKTAPGVDPKAIERRIWQITSLQPAMKRVLLRSAGEDAAALDGDAARKRILGEGVPVVWAYMAVEDGVLTGSPGHGGYPDGYDPRKRPWYEVARTKRGPQWAGAYVDASGAGLVVPVSMGLYDSKGAFAGAAALDISIMHLIDALLDPPDLGAPVEAWLVDGEGKVVVRSSLKARARDKDYVQEPFPYADALRVARDGGGTGTVEVEAPDGRDRLLVWSHLDAVDWTYLVEGDPSELLR